MKIKLFQKVALSLAVLAVAGSGQAQTFNYNSDDLLVCFRNTGSAVNDLVVDCGPVSTFTNLATGNQIVINPAYYNGSQLASVGTNNLAWSAFADDNNSPFYVNLWMTRPRPSFDTQSSPWSPGNLFAQGPTAGKIESVGNDALSIGLSLPAGPNNTTTALVEAESGHAQQGNGSYVFYMGSGGNFSGAFPGNVEQTTPANFTTGAQNVRADFYQMLSTNATVTGAQAVKYLGYFELSTNGVLTYTAGPSPSVVATPVITSITHSGTTNTITFTTGPSGTYSLQGTNSLTTGTSRTNWPVIASTPGNGSPQFLNDVNTNAVMFYIISAQ
jgi:hypothetical protein